MKHLPNLTPWFRCFKPVCKTLPLSFLLDCFYCEHSLFVFSLQVHSDIFFENQILILLEAAVKSTARKSEQINFHSMPLAAKTLTTLIFLILPNHTISFLSSLNAFICRHLLQYKGRLNFFEALCKIVRNWMCCLEVKVLQLFISLFTVYHDLIFPMPDELRKSLWEYNDFHMHSN